MQQRSRRITRFVPWTLVVLLVAVSGLQLASAKSRAGYIHACVDKKTRVVHIVSVNKACSRHQVSKGWDARGPRGRRGRRGPAADLNVQSFDVCVGPSGQLSLADSRGSGDTVLTPADKGDGGNGNGNGNDDKGDNGKGNDDKGDNDHGHGDGDGDGHGNGNGDDNGHGDDNGQSNGGDDGHGNGNDNGGSCTTVLKFLTQP
jgi:hypothetical protein